jgi:hypothetical protein
MKAVALIAALMFQICTGFMGWMRQSLDETRLSRAMQDLNELKPQELHGAADPWGGKYAIAEVSHDEQTVVYAYSNGPDGRSSSFGSDPDDVTTRTSRCCWIEHRFQVVIWILPHNLC